MEFIVAREVVDGVTAHNTHAHAHAHTRTHRGKEGGIGQYVAASAAHEYSVCKLLQLFFSSNRGTPSPLLPSPIPFTLPPPHHLLQLA